MSILARKTLARFNSACLASKLKVIVVAILSLCVLIPLQTNAATLVLQEIGDSRAVNNPLFVTAPSGDPNRAFVVGQGGVFVFMTVRLTHSPQRHF